MAKLELKPRPGAGAFVAGTPTAVPNVAGDAIPATPIPAGATDTHVHIYDKRFLERSGKTRDVGTVAQYRLLMRRLGLTHLVVDASNAYNQNNDCLLDALEQFAGYAVGTAIVQPTVTEQEIERLHDGAVRGIRTYLGKNVWDPADLARVDRMLAPRGWHIEIQPSTGDSLIAAEALIGSLACRVVIPHFAMIPQPDGIRHPAVAVLDRLLASGRTYLKLSGNYATSKVGFPHYSDLDALATHFVTTAPERVLWGSDWPHTDEVYPDDALVIDQARRWCPDAAAFKLLMVDNPERLYWRP